MNVEAERARIRRCFLAALAWCLVLGASQARAFEPAFEAALEPDGASLLLAVDTALEHPSP